MALALLHLLPLATRPTLIGGDEPHYALMAHSLAFDRDVELADDYAAVEAGSPAAGRKRRGQKLDHHLVPWEERLVFAHPLGLPLLSAPIVRLAGEGESPDLPLLLLSSALGFAALLAAWHLLRRRLANPGHAALALLALYFATPLWYYNRTLFTEPWLVSLAVLALASLDRGRWWPAGLCLALSFWVKETAVLWIAPIALWALLRHGPRRVAQLLALPALAFLLWCGKNWLLYGQAIATFQPYELGSWASGLPGVLLDPRHGLLPFAPTLLALAAWPWLQRASPKTDGERYGLLAAFGLLLVTAGWVAWQGGTCYGPRLMLPTIVALAPLYLRVQNAALAGPSTTRLLQALIAAGLTLQLLAAADPVRAFRSVSVQELLLDKPAHSAAALLVAVTLIAVSRRAPS